MLMHSSLYILLFTCSSTTGDNIQILTSRNVLCVHKYVIAHLTINKSRETDYMPKYKQYYNAKLHLNM